MDSLKLMNLEGDMMALIAKQSLNLQPRHWLNNQEEAYLTGLTIGYLLRKNLSNLCYEIIGSIQSMMDSQVSLKNAWNAGVIDGRKELTNPRLVAQAPMDIGGHLAESYLPCDYEGIARVEVNEGSFPKLLAVVPNVTEAKRVASYAITPDGGYAHVILTPARDGDEITHERLEDWI